ncbi:rRNA biogenesis protein RRP5 [Aulographum hederae CBS 113979]|uniref:rRNA biogenesis protein RRP5 n=1 Tax=Aulographum hederae CBS 113979 TaxID=1176131 RepID=A0A6G1GNF4_9PEZI|nr:rRNA biogenesis protein RRP5 [Aulographum hederae CBS 113979]
MPRPKRPAEGDTSTSKKPKPTFDERPPKKPRKNEIATDDISTGAQKPSILKQGEKAFPRGGASVLTPLEHKQIQIEATRDVLFEQAGKSTVNEVDEEDGDIVEASRAALKRKKKKAKPLSKGVPDELAEQKTKIESLGYKRLVEDSMVLGQVTQITRRDIALALPNNLTGYVPITSISDQLTAKIDDLLGKENEAEDDDEESDDFEDVDLKRLFKLGQYLRAAVRSVQNEDIKTHGPGKRHIELSLNPHVANGRMSKTDIAVGCTLQAAVKSVEDHGLVMDLGMNDQSVNGFLPSKALGPDIDHSTMEEGSVLLCLVTGSSSNGSMVQLSANHQASGATKKAKFLTTAPTVNTFLPGTAVEFQVTEVQPSGVVGQLMGMQVVTADRIHSGGATNSKELEELYSVGNRTKARILCSFPGSEPPKLGITLLPHILSLSPHPTTSRNTNPLSILPISAFVDNAKVVKVVDGMGLFMELGESGCRGFAHISRISDDKVEDLSSTSGRYKLGSSHHSRVVGYNPIDGLYRVSLEKKVLEQAFLRVEDVPVGQVLKCSVEKLIFNDKGAGGLLLKLSDGITGLCPENHMSDIQLRNPERKFKEGSVVNARVLSVDPEKRRIQLTLKKSLVNSDEPIWSDYTKILPGAQSLGTIVSVVRGGAVLKFYGAIRGFLPVFEMSDSLIEDATRHFKVGQVIKVRVLNVDPGLQRMTLSCKDPSSLSEVDAAVFAAMEIGSVVDGIVTEKNADTIKLEIADSNIKATLQQDHLTDGSEAKNASALKKIHVGQKLQDLVVLEKIIERSSVVLTKKASLVKAARSKTLVSSFDGIHEGREVQGFVRAINNERAFVQFAGRVVGLLRKSQIEPEMANAPNLGLRVGQSLTCKVLSVFQAQQQFQLTMKKQKVAQSEIKTTETSTPRTNDMAVVNPVDEKSMNVSDFVVGKETKARITSIRQTQLNVQLGDNLQGRIDVSEAFDSWEKIKNPKQPLKMFQPKEILDVRVLGIHDARGHRFLPITHRSNGIPVFELSTKRHNSDDGFLTMDKIQNGSSWVAFVNNIDAKCVWVNLSPTVRGRIDLRDLADDISLLKNVEEYFPIGSALRVRVKAVDASMNRLDLTAKVSSGSKSLTIEDVSKGMILPGTVVKVTEQYIMVRVSDAVLGQVPLTEFADDYSKANPTIHNMYDVVRVCVIGVDVPNKRILLSLRPSKVLNSKAPVQDPAIATISQLKVNDVVRGFVHQVADNGVFVTLGPTVTAFVRVSDLSDSYVKDWKSLVEIDQLVNGKITTVDSTANRIHMSLKDSLLNKDFIPPITFSDIAVGQVVTGKVRKVQEYGVFIVVDNSHNVSGLCHRSEIADSKIGDVRTLFDEGDAVKALVLKIDKDQRRISFGLKASYFQNQPNDGETSDEDDDGVGGVVLDEAGSEESDIEMEEGGADLDDVESIESEEEIAEDLDSDAEMENATSIQPSAGLSTSGFDWTGDALDADEKSSAAAGSENEAPTKKKKRRKPEIQVDKTGDLDKDGPKSVADFERLLLTQPNDSGLWIQYIAFQLQLGEVGKARDIAERALKTIHIREEDDKLNVWVALLSLENAYGSDETLEETFKRAVQYNDVQEIHERLASIYIESGKHDKAETLFQSMTKLRDINPHPAFWYNYAHFLLTTVSAPSRAHALLPRALQSVPPHLHRDLTTKFAILEFQSPAGDAERGRTLFEGLVTQWPKKGDLWDVWVDMEIKVGETEKARELFERMVQGKMKKKRAKFVFGRWREMEKKAGGKKGLERVQKAEKEYTGDE